MFFQYSVMVRSPSANHANPMLEDTDLDLFQKALLAGQIEVEDYMLAICWLSANHHEDQLGDPNERSREKCH